MVYFAAAEMFHPDGNRLLRAGGLILRSEFTIRLVLKKRPTVVRLVSQGHQHQKHDHDRATVSAGIITSWSLDMIAMWKPLSNLFLSCWPAMRNQPQKHKYIVGPSVGGIVDSVDMRI
jgi:hypothetical protein